MNGQLQKWLDEEMEEYAGLFKEFRKKAKRFVPLWMAVSIVAMVALGLGVGYDFAYVARLHLPIGVGIAAVIWFCYWIQGRVTSVKKVEKAYREAMKDFFTGPDEEDNFCRQMQAGNYEKINFMNTKLEQYPGRCLVGPDYWLFFSGGGYCRMFRTADIEQICDRVERTNVSAGNMRGKVTIGVSLVVTYRAGSPSTKSLKGNEASFFFQNGSQFNQVMKAVAQRCPRSQEWGR